MHRTTGLAIVLSLAVAAAGLGQDKDTAAGKGPAAAVAETGRAALAQGSYEEARGAFERELAAAEQRGDRAAQADLLFYLGLTEQQKAAGLAPEDPEHRRRLEESVDFYRRAARLKSELGQPTSPTFNNLGRVYADLGWPEAARDLLQKALEKARDDPRRPLYAKGYARQLAATGSWSQAARWYREVLKAWPEDAEAHQALIALYREHEPAELPGYLWWLVERGQVDSAQAAAITVLAGGGATGEVGASLLGVVAGTLAKQYGAPGRFQESSAWKELAPLRTNESIGPGVRELELLYAARDLQPGSYRWWRTHRQSPGRDAPSPFQAFRQLAVAIGQWHKRGATPAGLALAEQYFLLASRLSEREPDPVSFFELADLYVQAGRKEDLARLSEQSQALFQSQSEALFQGKGQAYQRGDWRAIFDFHRALGLFYGMTEKWGDSQTPDSAIFQLEHLRRATEVYNRGRPAGTEPLSVSPQFVVLLAYGYETTGRTEDARTLKAQAAAEYRRNGDEESARLVLSARFSARLSFGTSKGKILEDLDTLLDAPAPPP